MAGSKEGTTEAGGGAEKMQNFNLRLREELHQRLKHYVDTYARRHESMNFIINRAIETELDRLEEEVKK